MKKVIILLIYFLQFYNVNCQSLDEYRFHLKLILDDEKVYSSYYKDLISIGNDPVLGLMNFVYFAEDTTFKLMDNGKIILNGVEIYVANKKFGKSIGESRKGIEFKLELTNEDSLIINAIMRSNGRSTLLKKKTTFARIDLDFIQAQSMSNVKKVGDRGVDFEGVRLNKPMLGFSFTDIENVLWDSRELEGKVVVLNFWFTGCKPCLQEIPDLNKLVNSYNDDSVVFLAFANDSEGTLKKFLERFPFKYRIIPNSESFTLKSLQIESFPTHVIISKKGLIRFISSGYSGEVDKKLGLIIDTLL